MRKIIYVIILLLPAMLQWSCSKNTGTSEADIAKASAQQYYSYLIDGKYDAFVDGTWHDDSLRPAYRQQLIDGVKQFVRVQKDQRGGLQAVSAHDVILDTVRHEANVILQVTFGDNTHEQVSLPMIKKNELWYMK